VLVSSGAGGLEEPAVGEVLWWWDQRGVSGSCLENVNLLGCRFRCFPRSLLMPGPLSLRVFSRADELAAVGAVPLRWPQSSSAEGGERGRAPAHPETFVQRQRRQHFPCCKKKKPFAVKRSDGAEMWEGDSGFLPVFEGHVAELLFGLKPCARGGGRSPLPHARGHPWGPPPPRTDGQPHHRGAPPRLLAPRQGERGFHNLV